MEDIYLLHTYESITKDKSLYKIKKVEQIQTNVLQHSRDNNVLFQLYIKIINYMKKNN